MLKIRIKLLCVRTEALRFQWAKKNYVALSLHSIDLIRISTLEKEDTMYGRFGANTMPLPVGGP